jgi:hypothetical protein
MKEPKHLGPQLPFVRRLCGHLSEHEIQEAEASFWRYVEIVRRIHERINREEVSPPRFDKP